jgi:Zn-dependent protease
MELAETISAPPPIYNCRVCSHYLPAGTLACPECGALVYGPHVAKVADAAQTLEGESRWDEARATWSSALQWLPQGTTQAGAVLARVESIDARSKAADDKKARWTKRLGPLAPVLLLLAKVKGVLFLLFKLKFLFGFFAFFGLYWALFGWKFGLGFTLSILVHELGHYYAVRRRGLKADLPVFLPGLGAYVRWYAMGIPVEGLASIALAGPLFGLGVALVCLGLYRWTGGQVYLALAHTGAFINLLNLIPVLGLDGAQATYALSRLQRGLLLVSAVVLYGLMQQGVLLFLAAGMAWRMFTKDVPEKAGSRTMVFYLALLFALGAFLRIVPPGTVGR